jgi:hypothetical protein
LSSSFRGYSGRLKTLLTTGNSLRRSDWLSIVFGGGVRVNDM